MKTTFLKRTLAVAVVGALVPAYAQTTSSSSANAPVSRPAAAKTQSGTTANTTGTSTSTNKPLCSTLDHPNAGKLANKDAGKAKEHSNSPVHMDCIDDSASASTGSSLG